jgi:hypothetical protein
VPDPGFEPGPPPFSDPKNPGSNPGFLALEGLYIGLYRLIIRVTRRAPGHPRPTRGQPRVNPENRSDPHGVTLILVAQHVLRVPQKVLSPSERGHFFDPRGSNHRPSTLKAHFGTPQKPPKKRKKKGLF